MYFAHFANFFPLSFAKQLDAEGIITCTTVQVQYFHYGLLIGFFVLNFK